MKLKIKHNIADQTIKFEKKRNIESMDKDSLFWCLEVSIDFINQEKNEIILHFDEISLIGFASQLFDCYKTITKNGKQVSGDKIINDFNGSFQIIIKSKNNNIEINEPHKNITFIIEYNNFKSALFKWFNEINNDLKNIFPEIKENNNYLQIEKEIFLNKN